MKFEAASTVPGFANSSQNGTDPSAKSIQTGFLAGSEQALPVAASGAPGRAEAVRPTTASSTSRSVAFFILERAKRRSKLAPARGVARDAAWRQAGFAGLPSQPHPMKRRPPGRSPSSRESALALSRLFVQRSVDLGDLLGLSLFLRRVLLAEVGSAAEV